MSNLEHSTSISWIVLFAVHFFMFSTKPVRYVSCRRRVRAFNRPLATSYGCDFDLRVQCARIGAINIWCLLWIPIRTHTASFLSSFLPTTKHRNEATLTTSHWSQFCRIYHFSKVHLFVRSFHLIIHSSKFLLYGARRAVLYERCSFRL